MSEILFFKRLRENVNRIMIALVLVFMIAFIFSACAGKSKMQTSSNSNETATALASAKDDSEISEIIGDQSIECRKIAVTGSRFKRKICKTKAEWARIDSGGRSKTAEDMQRAADRSYSTAVPVANDGGSFPGAAVPR